MTPARALHATIRPFIMTSSLTSVKSCAIMCLSTLCTSPLPALEGMKKRPRTSIGVPMGFIKMVKKRVKQSHSVPSRFGQAAIANFHACNVVSRTSARSSTIRFWKRSCKNGWEIHGDASAGTERKLTKVLTTESRTEAMTWRKNGKRIGARWVNGRLREPQNIISDMSGHWARIAHTSLMNSTSNL